jgi:hypothetical protein
MPIQNIIFAWVALIASLKACFSDKVDNLLKYCLAAWIQFGFDNIFVRTNVCISFCKLPIKAVNKYPSFVFIHYRGLLS